MNEREHNLNIVKQDENNKKRFGQLRSVLVMKVNAWGLVFYICTDHLLKVMIPPTTTGIDILHFILIPIII